MRRTIVIGTCALLASLAVVTAPTVAATAASSRAASRTTLTTSASAAADDSTVDLVAHVTAAGWAATGVVTFADLSNRSVLGAEPLRGGVARFATSALAPGPRQIIAVYAGDKTLDPSRSTVRRIDVGPSHEDVAYQVNPSHDGDQTATRLDATGLSRKWTVKLGPEGAAGRPGEAISSPLIADGRIFVTVETSKLADATLEALDTRSGTIDWKRPLADVPTAGITYGGGRVFALDDQGKLVAYAAATGRAIWSRALSRVFPEQWFFTAAPTAYDGIVYVAGAGVGGTLYAVTEAQGLLLWTAPVQNGGSNSSPAVDTTGAYVSYSCQQEYRFRATGLLVWHRQDNCDGGGGSTGALHGAFFYSPGFMDTPRISAVSNGALRGTYASTTIPAFDGATMFTLQNGHLRAGTLTDSSTRWTSRQGDLVTAPVADDGVVYAGDANGTVYGFSTRTGAKVWSARAGSSINDPTAFNIGLVDGLGVAAGVLAAPTTDGLSVFTG